MGKYFELGHILMVATWLALTAAPTPGSGKRDAKSRVEAAPNFVLGGDAAKGEAKFKEICAVCHGPVGKGDGPAGGSLNPRPANFADPATAPRLTGEHIYRVIKEGGAKNGRSALMVAFGGVLNEDELRNVVAYVVKLRGPIKSVRK